MTVRRAPAVEAERIAPGEWALIPDWDEVVAASTSPSVFLTHAWIDAWWRNFGGSAEPWLVRVRASDGVTIGLVPFYLKHVGRASLRRVGLIGDRVVGSEYLGIAARTGTEREVAQSAAALLRAAGVRWEIAELCGLREGDPAAVELERELSGCAQRTVEDRHPCSAIALPDSFDAYLSSLPAKLRQNVRRRSRNLGRDHSLRFFVTAAESELDQQLDTLYRLHQTRWTEEGEWGAFADPRMRGFYRDVSRSLLAAGRLRFWHLEVDGVVRATQFGFVYDGRFHSLQEGFDTGIGADTGLGMVLRAHVLRSCIEEGVHTYDFLGGDEPHKTRWGTSLHHVRRVRLVSRGNRGRLAWLATVGVESAREVVKAALPEGALEGLRDVRRRHRRMLSRR